MKYYIGNDDIKLNNSIVTIGKFDGIHRGHQALINIINKNKKNGDTSVLITFGQIDNIDYIYTEEEKKKLVTELGIDVMIVYPFDDRLKNIEAEEFLEEILIKKLGAKMIIVGSDFCFGKDRKGDKEFLKNLSKQYNYELIVCEKERNSDNKIISSTMIREDIQKSRMDKVTDALGKNYSISGTIVKGRQLGRTIGFPTINIFPNKNKIMPLNGVYESEVVFVDNIEKSYKGITNIGNRPTIASGLEKNIETYIFDFNKDVYGKDVIIYLKEFIRPEMKFNSIEELKERLEMDKNSIIF